MNSGNEMMSWKFLTWPIEVKMAQGEMFLLLDIHRKSHKVAEPTW